MGAAAEEAVVDWVRTSGAGVQVALSIGAGLGAGRPVLEQARTPWRSTTCWPG